MAATMKGDQGYYDASTGSNLPAENRFYTSCNNANSPGSRERLFADIFVTEPVNYYVDPGGAEFDPTTGCITGNYSAVLCPSSVDRTKYCDPLGIYVEAQHTDDPFPTDMVRRLDSTLQHTPEDATMHSYVLAERDMLVSDWVRYCGRIGALDSAGKILVHYGRYTEALPFYMESRNWAAANEAWASLPQVTEDEENFSTLTRMAIDLYSTGKSWRDIDSSGKELLLALADKNTYPGYMAAAAVEQQGLRTVIWPYAIEDEGTAGKGTGGNNGPVSVGAVNKSLRLYPNPTNGQFTLQSLEAGTLSLFSIQGTMVSTQNISNEVTLVRMPSILPSGVYYGRFISVSGKTEQVKIVYTK